MKESLPDYVRRIRQEHRLSLSDVENASRRAGWKIVSTYVSRIENGVNRNPSIDKLIALAFGLGVPLEELLSVASGKPLQNREAQEIRLVVMFRELPEDRRDDVMNFVRMLHKQYAVKPNQVGHIASKKKPRAA